MRILDPIIYFINSPILQPKRYQSVANTLERLDLCLKHNGRVYYVFGWCDTIYCKTLSDVEDKIITLQKTYNNLFCLRNRTYYQFDTPWSKHERY